MTQTGAAKHIRNGDFVVRDAHSGVLLTVPETRFRMPNTNEIGKAISVESGGLNRLLKALGSVTKRSREVGAALQFTIQIEPDGEPQIVEMSTNQSSSPRLLSEALADARVRGRNRIAEILSGSEMLSADMFAKYLGTTRATINTWRNQHRVIGLDGPKRGCKYPVWQIGENGRPFDALPALFEVFGGSPWAVYRFMVQHHGELGGRTGAEALRRGQDVVEAARGVAEAYA